MEKTQAFRNPALKDVRVFSVKRLEIYPVFYKPIANGIEIIRILEGAGDIGEIIEC